METVVRSVMPECPHCRSKLVTCFTAGNMYFKCNTCRVTFDIVDTGNSDSELKIKERKVDVNVMS